MRQETKMEIGNIKKNHSEIKNILTELKTTLQGINRDRDETEDKIRDLKDKGAENTQSEQQKEKRILKIRRD